MSVMNLIITFTMITSCLGFIHSIFTKILHDHIFQFLAHTHSDLTSANSGFIKAKIALQKCDEVVDSDPEKGPCRRF